MKQFQVPDWLNRVARKRSMDVWPIYYPYTITMNDKRWVCAYNMELFAAIRVPDDEKTNGEPSIHNEINQFAEQVIKADTPYFISHSDFWTQIADLRGDNLYYTLYKCDKCEDGYIECQSCGGDGWIQGGRESTGIYTRTVDYAVCYDCGSHKVRCVECKGEKKVDCYCMGDLLDPSYVMKAQHGGYFDMGLLWRAASYFEADYYRIGHVTKEVLLSDGKVCKDHWKQYLIMRTDSRVAAVRMNTFSDFLDVPKFKFHKLTK